MGGSGVHAVAWLHYNDDLAVTVNDAAPCCKHKDNLFKSTELQLRLKSEVSETEERKNAQIEDIRKKNEKAFTEIKNYYNDITLNNLAMISTLKEEIKNKDEKLERNEQLLGTVQVCIHVKDSI